MEAHTEKNQSMFETSHVLGTELASSPLLAQAWRQCELADAADDFLGRMFTVEEVDGVLYVAFSGVQCLRSMNGGLFGDGFFSAVPLSSAGARALFAPLVGEEGGGEMVVVQACVLQLFLSIYGSSELQMLAKEVNDKEVNDKEVIFTGHSIGGSLAALVTLYFLCSSMSLTSFEPSSLLCVTFGSPLLGNEALSQVILRERWTGKFCHVVSQHDFLPRLLFCPQHSFAPQITLYLLETWRFSNAQKAELHQFITSHIATLATDQKLSLPNQSQSLFMPFGCYALCSTEGIVCIDNPVAVIRLLCLTFVTGSPKYAMEEKLSYGDLVTNIQLKLLQKKMVNVGDGFLILSYDAGTSLALEASGIGVQDMLASEARGCLDFSRKLSRSPSMKCANLSIRLAKITPCRAQIEWYKASCDKYMGYYDSFKQRKASKRDYKVNMNRVKLARFWDDFVNLLQNNQLPHDVQKRAKWVNAARFYQLLVEPLDIAEYYRVQMHKTKGHYLTHGRERRYQVFYGWWRAINDVNFDTDGKKRSKFAGLTQDPCFWARVEEVREMIKEINSEKNPSNLSIYCEKLKAFEDYAGKLVEMKEVSIDVLAPNSSYCIWVEEWKALKVSLGFHL